MTGADLVGTRVERVLDAAGELLVRWGYQRVTIDEVARHAGIGKGTVYLHFRTKEALFVTVLLRAQAGVAERMAKRIDDDPAHALPSRLSRSLYLDLTADPVLRALYLADVEVLGRLAHEAVDTIGDLSARRAEGLDEHLRLLQEIGCLRADMSLRELRYTFSAVGAGFFFLDGFGKLAGDLDLPVAERADLLERAIAAALQVPEPPVAELERVAPVVASLYRSLLEHIDHEWRHRVR